jgi:hypothetical protein
MAGRITLITPPDFFENGNLSILFGHITAQEQDAISKWLYDANVKENLNLYVYTDEPNPSWFLYALNRCEHKYINADYVNLVTQSLIGYALTRNNVYYKTSNENLSSIYSHINSNRVEQVENFLESILGAKTTNEPPL